MPREFTLGASNAYSLLRENGPMTLWLEKTGRQPREDLDRILKVQMGIFTEPLNRRWYVQETGHQTAGAEQEYIHREYPWLIAHPDDQREADDGSLVVIDYKHTAQDMFEPRLLDNYTPQIHIQAACAASATGREVKTGELSVLFGNAFWRRYVMDIVPEYTAELLRLYRNFHACLVNDTPPDPAAMTPPKNTPPPPVPWRVLDMSESNAWAENAAAYISTKHAAGQHKAADKALKDAVASDVRSAHGHGVELTQTGKRRAIKILEGGEHHVQTDEQ